MESPTVRLLRFPGEKKMSQQTNENILSFDQILSADDTQYDVIEVPEWGGKVRVGTLSAAQLLEFVEANEDPQKKKRAGVRLLVQSLVDGQGKRQVRPEGLEDAIAKMMDRDSTVITRCVKQVLKLNGLNKSVQDEEKNESGEVASAASPTV